MDTQMNRYFMDLMVSHIVAKSVIADLLTGLVVGGFLM